MADDLVAGSAEHKDIVVADALVDFHIRSVLCAEGDGSVQHEFHVSGTAGLFGGERNLLGDIAGRDQLFGHRHIVVFHHDDFEPGADLRIVVYDLLQAQDQMNDILGNHIGGSGFRPENCRDGSGRNLAGLDFQVLVNDVEGVQLLALILMETFDLDIKDGIRADFQLLCFFQVCAQSLLVFLLDFQKLFEYLFVLLVREQLFQLGRVLFVAFPDSFIQKFCQERIAVEKPAAEGDSVRLVVELLRVEPVKVVKL